MTRRPQILSSMRSNYLGTFCDHDLWLSGATKHNHATAPNRLTGTEPVARFADRNGDTPLTGTQPRRSSLAVRSRSQSGRPSGTISARNTRSRSRGVGGSAPHFPPQRIRLEFLERNSLKFQTDSPVESLPSYWGSRSMGSSRSRGAFRSLLDRAGLSRGHSMPRSGSFQSKLSSCSGL
jgi:hypothetical protein